MGYSPEIVLKKLLHTFYECKCQIVFCPESRLLRNDQDQIIRMNKHPDCNLLNNDARSFRGE